MNMEQNEVKEGTKGWAIFRIGLASSGNPPSKIYKTKEEAEEKWRTMPGGGAGHVARRATWVPDQKGGHAEPHRGPDSIDVLP